MQAHSAGHTCCVGNSSIHCPMLPDYNKALPEPADSRCRCYHGLSRIYSFFVNSVSIISMSRQPSHSIVPGPKSSKPRDPVAAGTRDAAVNRAASHNYFLLDKFEAGVALRGTEVKSIREGKANLKDSYGIVKDGEAFLLNAHIGPYSHGNISNHDALRTRKLLLHQEELRKLISKTQQKGLTLIPTRLYFRNGRVKCEIAVAKGKQDWDKRETERRREADKEARAAIARSRARTGN